MIRKQWIAPLLAAPLILLFAIFFVVPFIEIMRISFSGAGGLSASFQWLWNSPVVSIVFLNTLKLAVTVTLICLVLGYPAACFIALQPSSRRGIWLALILLPFWTSVLVRSYAWMVLLGRHGLVNEGLIALGLIDRPIRILNTSIATQIAMIHILLPYMILPIANALRQIDPSLIRAASGLGSTPFMTFRQVILPLSMSGVAAGTLLTFVLALGFYITPAMVGGPRDITLSMLIAQQVDQLNWAYAATLSAVLLATALAILAAARRLPGVGNAFKTSMR